MVPNEFDGLIHAPNGKLIDPNDGEVVGQQVTVINLDWVFIPEPEAKGTGGGVQEKDFTCHRWEA